MDLVGAQVKLVVLFEDARLIAVHKPVGQLVIPGRGESAGVCLRDECTQRAGRPLFVVHRIDRETSGVVLFAKDADTHRILCGAFENRLVKKEYWAAVVGIPSRPRGTLESALRQCGSGRVAPDPHGKPSRTEYETLAHWPGGALLSVNPLTGRRHQIRVHLNEMGHPILGDPLYGPSPRPIGGAPRLMLHARRITVPFPQGGSRSVDCPPGDDFYSYLNVVSKSEIVYLDPGRVHKQ